MRPSPLFVKLEVAVRTMVFVAAPAASLTYAGRQGLLGRAVQTCKRAAQLFLQVMNKEKTVSAMKNQQMGVLQRMA